MDKENQSESENFMYQTSDGSFVSIECLVVFGGSASADLTRSQLIEITFTVECREEIIRLHPQRRALPPYLRRYPRLLISYRHNNRLRSRRGGGSIDQY